MEPTGLLTPEHPSYETETAAFMFAVSGREGAIRKFIIVEANNRLAVHTIERVIAPTQAASETCRCIAIFRGLESLGTRDSLLEEVPYVDFMLDIVSQDLLMDDSAAVEGFNKSLSKEECEYARRKIEAEGDRPPTVSETRLTTVSETRLTAPVGGPSDEERLSQALRGFGFRTKAVQQFVASVRDKIGNTDLGLLIREGCKALAA
jgi:hypothetical protein